MPKIIIDRPKPPWFPNNKGSTFFDAAAVREFKKILAYFHDYG